MPFLLQPVLETLSSDIATKDRSSSNPPEGPDLKSHVDT